ncbi:hypothetical protein HPB48_014744 [Haemaphysalis longicornis]|uniref:Uncharacterized protein n=1 Tax=Haemaphysalis longicornis TaxID=44386 RepID=A0A9J6FLP6_HAELO|nr:hypothetical protein HPB48_014744 [Haemaphysalis longicornis]
MADPKGQATRARFTVEDDINLLKEICAENPFKDSKAWLVIAKNIEVGTKRIFTVRAIRDRCDLLLAQFVHEDRTNLKKSGTEEQYDEKHHLLQDTLDLAKEFGYQIKRSAVRKITVARSHQRSDTAAERTAASTARDTAAAAAVSRSSADSLTQPENPEYVLQYVYEDNARYHDDIPEDTRSSGEEGPSDDLQGTTIRGPSSSHGRGASGSQVLSVRELLSFPPQQTSQSTDRPTSASQVPSVSRPREPENNLQFFQRRLTHENGWHDQENSRELRRLALEEKRLDFEWASLEQRKAEWKAACEEREEERRLRMEEAAELRRERKQEQEERAEERRLLLAQQEALLQQRAEEHRMFMAQQEALLNVIRALAIKK